MNARGIMSAPVVTVAPGTRVEEIASLLLRRGISGVPVVSAGRVVGIVSEGDLLLRHEIGTDRSTPKQPWWLRWLAPGNSAVAYVKSHALKAKDIMTRDVITVNETTPLGDIASILKARGIRRVPVLGGGRLTGIVTRTDVVKALDRRHPSVPTARSWNDDAIRAELLAELQRQPWWRSEWTAVWVTDGVVYYRGLVESEAERRAARVAAENVPGVRSVVDRRVGFADWQPLV